MIDAEYLKRERNPKGCGQYSPTSYYSVSGSFEAVGAQKLYSVVKDATPQNII
jgi:hypothetical protein